MTNPASPVPQTCGVATHPEHCTCDVNIVEPMEDKYDLMEIWHARAIARALDYRGKSDSDEAFHAFADDFLKAYDAFKNARDMPLRVEVDGDVVSDVLGWLRAGESMIDTPRLLEESRPGSAWTLGEVLQMLTNNVVSKLWVWSDLDWIRMEGMLLSPTRPSARQMGEALDVPDHVIEQTILGWYGDVVVGKKGTKSDPDAKARRAFIADNLDMSNAELLAQLEADGLACTGSSVRNMRAKILAAA